ncbi:calmodulin-binding protein 60 A-like [Impatiens glandulifera]|uniref:calmodulin-binding protein 60 A-like n=1 Tax=Impatiens glandulifera TaxID=253017 RepID=UPI001FB12EDB|nr:calmodulin-binding protein 60 A-like [Impatiens glandulifera]XP_047329883.1 calmodulin-binding protein 60 A-like [Impatiens glandulifera]
MPQSTDDAEVGGRTPLRKLPSVVTEIMKMTVDAESTEAEHLMSGMVDEEVELAMANQLHLGSRKCDLGNKTANLESRSLHLEFSVKLHSPALTGRQLRGEGSTSLQVVLVNSHTGQIVRSGPESSAQVEIVLLSPDFSVSNWTAEDFNDKIVRGNGGKRLLTGDVQINLKDGVGILSNVSFTHTKCWRSKCEFRLGARVLKPTANRVREAKTEPFGVEDRRGQLYGKHYPPLLSDQVWRLKCIMKDGAYHKRLEKEGVNTVKDLWTLLNTNQQRLHNILTGMAAKLWEELVDHLRTCILDTKLNFYWCSLNQNGVVFNVVGQIVGIFEKHQYTAIQNLSGTQKDLAVNLVASALTNFAEVTTFDDEASLFDSFSRLSIADQPLESPQVSESNQMQLSSLDEFYIPDILITDDQILNQPSPISDHIVTFDDYQPLPPVCSESDTIGINDFSFWDRDNNVNEMYNRHLDFPSPKTYSIICEANDIMQAYNNNHDFEDNNIRDTVMTTTSQKKCFSKRRAQIRWRKLSNVLKFVSVRQDVAKKGKVENNGAISFHERVALNDIVRARSAVAGLGDSGNNRRRKEIQQRVDGEFCLA